MSRKYVIKILHFGDEFRSLREFDTVKEATEYAEARYGKQVVNEVSNLRWEIETVRYH